MTCAPPESPGPSGNCAVRAYLDLLQEGDSRVAAGEAAAGQVGRPAGPDGPGGDGGPNGPPDASPGPDGSDPGGNRGPGPQPGTGPSVAALVNVTVPLSTLLGESETPGEAAGFGLLDGQDTRDLVAAAARHPGTRWCVTALHPDGTAAAHGCARGRHPPPPGATEGPDPPSDVPAQDYLRRLGIGLAPVARGRCDHARAEQGYQPSRRLQHLVRARNRRCAAPGCSRPAARCDLDHTIAWDRGGLTCECECATSTERSLI